MNHASKRPANLVQTIERVDNLLDRLSRAPQGLSLGKLAEQAGLPKGTTHRLVSSLSYFNYIKQDPSSRRYKLGFKLVQFGNMLLEQIDLRSESRPYLLELAQRSQETAHLVVPDNDEALYIDKIQLSAEGLHMASRTGYRVPLYCTAAGKIILAHLPAVEIERIIAERRLPRRTVHTITDAKQLKSELQRIKNQGHALDNEEHTEGVRCVAAPIYNINGHIVAVVSISAPAVRVTLENAQQSIKVLVMDTAKKISNQLGYSNKEVINDDSL